MAQPFEFAFGALAGALQTLSRVVKLGVIRRKLVPECKVQTLSPSSSGVRMMVVAVAPDRKSIHSAGHKEPQRCLSLR